MIFLLKINGYNNNIQIIKVENNEQIYGVNMKYY